ncbi:hypothetical protein ABGB18_24900 [Nonomuraea sp. B12E4]|uniref:hypothetical protein n=1 Tax=Nonomuraea sp. B12E4 TaxID=3153564 RepID=UPI00325E97BC
MRISSPYAVRWHAVVLRLSARVVVPAQVRGGALGTLLRRFPGLALAGEARQSPGPGMWRLPSLPVTLGG